MTGTTDVIVIGAGFGGLYSLYKFREAGFNVLALEKAQGVGGTWYWNRYPGAACDINSLEYSYSFDDELTHEWKWKKRYASQSEILSYINHVADKHQLREHIRFGVNVVSATWVDDKQLWSLRDTNGNEYFSHHLVMATGCLSVPKPIDVDGMSDFTGEVYRTSEWPHSEVDLSGKRVGIFGTGSSGLQATPEIAKTADEVVVFQRTPAFSFPSQNQALPPQDLERFAQNRNTIKKKQHETAFGALAETSGQSALDVTDDTRREIFDKFWQSGDLVGAYSYFNDLLVNKEANDTMANFIKQKIREIVHDPVTAKKLTKMDYPVGTRRTCVDSGYFECFNNPNVTLVDVDEELTERITPDGVLTKKKQYDLDVIIFATGFDAITGALLAVDIVGREGRKLRTEWDNGPNAYLGFMTNGFPNMHMITGPQSPNILASMVLQIEFQVDWICSLLKRMRADESDVVEPTLKAQDGWSRFVKQVADMTLLPTTRSWYTGANIAGKPRGIMTFLGGWHEFVRISNEVAEGDYIGLSFEGSHGQKCTDGVVRSM